MLCDDLEGWDEAGGNFKREGIYVYLWLIHVDIWQKPTQYCKAIILQLKINKKFLKRIIATIIFSSLINVAKQKNNSVQ